MRSLSIIFVLLCCLDSFGQEFRLELISPQNDASFRGMSVVDDQVAWISGTKGHIGVTSDGGKTWKFTQVPGFEKFDFRSIYAFDGRRAVIANAGAPANILVTADGGLSWKTVYTNADTLAFFHGMDFWNEKEGIIYGDPIQGKMLLLKTTNGGLSWNESPENERPALNAGEASFAASGTNIRCAGSREVMIATGGTVSRLWFSDDKGVSWRSIAVPILQGEASTGIFSFCRKYNSIVVVGGNYLQDSLRVRHVFTTPDKGKTWSAPTVPTRGYRECVEMLSDRILVAAGPSGVDITRDKGQQWEPLSDEKYFHVIRKARKGKLVLVAGGKGKVAILRTD